MRRPVEILGETFPKTRLWIIFITLISVVAVLIFLNLSEWGLRIRAVTQNRSMSECLGLSTKKVDTLTFAIGSGLAGVAGVAVSLLGSVGPNVGQNYIVPCFMVVVLGGVGNLLGTVLASFGIGIMTDLIARGYVTRAWLGVYIQELDSETAEALEMVNDTVEGFLTSKIVHSDAKKRGLDLKILNFLIELYEKPKSLDEAKEIFQTDSIEEDIKFNF